MFRPPRPPRVAATRELYDRVVGAEPGAAAAAPAARSVTRNEAIRVLASAMDGDAGRAMKSVGPEGGPVDVALVRSLVGAAWGADDRRRAVLLEDELRAVPPRDHPFRAWARARPGEVPEAGALVGMLERAARTERLDVAGSELL